MAVLRGDDVKFLSIPAVLFATTVLSSPAGAQEAPPVWRHEIAYTADVTGVVAGGAAQAGRYLDNLEINVDGDLERVMGWRGARLHLSVLSNQGGEPNAVAGTLQGIDNIEVGAQGVRLFELWVEQDFRGGSVLAGLYDVNSEFYATDASGLLIAPPFGIGSELAATGPNGPSIFPSTALSVRLRLGDPDAFYAQAALVNADARTLGDEDGVNTTLNHGVLGLVEAGRGGPVRFAVGGWRYDRRQDDIRDLDPSGDPARSTAQGAYVLGEAEFWRGEQGLVARGFARVGVSDGDTTDFRGGWQAGLRLDHVIASRPDSAFSVGVHRGVVSDKARANLGDVGVDPAHAEEGLELTYADTVGRITVQPDLQLIRRPGADRDAETVVVAGLRLVVPLN